MDKKWQYLFFLIWFGYALIIALGLFTNGFFLNKTSLTHNATCVGISDREACNKDLNTHNKSLSEEISNFEFHQTCIPQISKVILVIIDAFRYDFAIYNETSQYEYYLNQVPVIHQLLNSEPNSTRLYKFVANAPTTTMQRLKALTTGTLPTFIDAGSNFATPEINEDNFIDEAVHFQKNIVFLGDDTWDGLYPKRFLRSYPFPSFNVHDLDTVDQGITGKIFNEMAKNDWDLLIAHYLGVDHCGHRYGPNHHEMKRKLNEMNEVLQNITSNLRDDEILIVVGDHGMTITGDHGGDSDDEITAAMFVHAKQPLIHLNEKEEVMQIDLVPTISSLLGVPVPYSNLGFLIINSLPKPAQNWGVILPQAAWNNINQIMNYIKVYASKFDAFSKESLQAYEEKFTELKARYDRATGNDDLLLRDIEELAVGIREMCEKEWTQFNSLDMIRGLLNFFATLFLVFILVDGITNETFHDIFTALHLSAAFVIILSPFLVYYSFANFLPDMKTYLPTVHFLSSIFSTGMFAAIVAMNWMKVPENWYESAKRRRWIDRASRCVLALSVCGLFSNSYIVEESLLLLYLWFTLIVLAVIDLDIPNIRSKYRRKITKARGFCATLTVIVTLRYTYYFIRCREEQQWCYGKGSLEKFTASRGSSHLLLQAAIAATSLVCFVRYWLRRAGNLTGYTSSVIASRFVPAIMVVLMCSYWILSATNATVFFEPWKLDVIAWCVYGLFGVSVLCVLLRPLMVDVQLRRNNQLSAMPSAQNVIPLLFAEIKTRLAAGGKNRDQADNVPIVCGLGTAYSALYLSLGVHFGLLWAFLLGAKQSTPVAILFLVMAFVLFLSAISRYERSSKIGDIPSTPNIFIIIWSLISYYFFYATGHQATFSSIVWDAAFVGTGGLFKSFHLQGLLIVINTFGSHILMGLTLPLLLIWPFSLQFVQTDLRPKRIDSENEMMTRGDILLYENDGWLFNNACILCCKYILLSGLRVFFSMLTATIHCRHLMVWSIFAPKLIFEIVALIVTILSVICGYALLILITGKLARLFEYIMKKSR